MLHGTGAASANLTPISLTPGTPSLSDVAGGIGHYTVSAEAIVAAGSGYTVSDVLTASGGTQSVPAEITVDSVVADTFHATGLSITAGGTAYSVNDVLVLTGGTQTTPAEITVDTITPAIFHVDGETITAAGTGYTANDVLTLGGGVFSVVGKITVDTVDAITGAVLTAHVSTPGTYSSQPGDPVGVTGGTGNDDATFTLTWTEQGAVLTAHVSTDGTYSVEPSDPVGVTGGTGNDDATFGITWTLDAAAGGVLTAHVSAPGNYTVKPSNAVTVTGGTGNDDATFNLTWATTSDTYYVKTTYVFAFGEQNYSAESSHAPASDRLLRVASPAANSTANGYNVYVGASGGETLQNDTPIAIGTNWTMPTSLLVAGAGLPTTITVDPTVAVNWIATLNSAATLANPANLTAGHQINIWFIQDGTGTRVITYGSQWQASGSVSGLVLSAGAGAKDLITGIADTSSSITAFIVGNISH